MTVVTGAVPLKADAAEKLANVGLIISDAYLATYAIFD